MSAFGRKSSRSDDMHLLKAFVKPDGFFCLRILQEYVKIWMEFLQAVAARKELLRMKKSNEVGFL
jgi:hypothetical protein